MIKINNGMIIIASLASCYCDLPVFSCVDLGIYLKQNKTIIMCKQYGLAIVQATAV